MSQTEGRDLSKPFTYQWEPGIGSGAWRPNGWMKFGLRAKRDA
jgi:hypothetical protein